jgi:hypothetical protein
MLKTVAMAACVGLLVGPLFAAPLDALLSAIPEGASPRGHIEVATDQMNGALDFFNVRDSRVDTAGTSAGDYSGTHVLGGFSPWEGVWLSGGLWQRRVNSASDSYRYDSWQIAGQYRFLNASGWVPSAALRLSAWGNSAVQTESTTAVVVPGARLNSVKITSPDDRSLQADLIGTWKLSASTNLSLAVGAGNTRLSYGALTATTTRDGCNYNVTFNGNDIFGELASPCSAKGGVVQQFYDSSGGYGVDVAKEIAWSASFAHAAINATWQGGPWKVTGAYLFTTIKRDFVDSILTSRGLASYTQNNNMTAQLDYHISPHVVAFGRAQLSSNLFFDDIPVTYNSSTASRFDSKYSLFTVGMLVNF